MIYKFKYFLLEHSLSDPIPELTWKKSGKTAIFLFGAPASGKSTFINNFLIPKLRNYKIFDPDRYINLLIRIGKEKRIRTAQQKKEKFYSIKNAINRLNKEYNIDFILKDEEIKNIIDNNLYVENLNNILKKRLISYIKYSNSDFIYDSTGNDFNRIKYYTKMAKDNNYTILYIKIYTTLNNIIHGNNNRKRIVQPDYQLYSFEILKKLEKKYIDLKPDAYYIYDRNNFKKLK